MIRQLFLFSFALAASVWVSAASAAIQVEVVRGSDAPALERLAADELASQFRRLFDAQVTVGTQPTDKAQLRVLVGSPQTNPAVRAAVGDGWPQLSDQGLVIRSLDLATAAGGKLPGLVVGGGSPVATLWAVYELGHRRGIRYLSRGDIFPDVAAEVDLTGLDMVIEPTLRTRTWRTINDFCIGPESWGQQDLKALLRQLAKMKFNDVMLSLWPWQPFVHYEFGGVQKRTATSWFGDRFRVDGDIPGKTVFGGAPFFENPDLAGKTDYQALTAAGIQLLRGVIDEAHRLGMTVCLSLQPAQFTKEFAAALPGSKAVHQLKTLTIGPGPQQGPSDPLLRKLVATKLRAYIETYPTVDSISLGMPEFPEWDEHAEAAWDELNADGRLGDTKLSDLVKQAAARNIIASGDRGVRALRGNIAPLVFFRKLFADQDLLKRPAGGRVKLIIRSIDPALFPVIDKVIPPGAATLNFIDYTARRIVDNRQLIATLPADKVDSRLIFTLADDNVGVLSQSCIGSLHELVADLRKHGWSGFSTRYWMLTELDPTLHYLSRAAFDVDVTPRSSHDDLFVAVTGKTSSSDRLWLAFEHIEQATNLVDQHALGFGFPVRGMMMKHYQPQPDPGWWKEVVDHYTEAMIEFYRSSSADPHARSRKLLFYYGKRSEYVLEYLNAVQALRAAAVAKKAGDTEVTIEKLETAVEQLYNSIDTLSDVVRDQSDRGLIATLANFAFRPLMAEYEKVLDESESE